MPLSTIAATGWSPPPFDTNTVIIQDTSSSSIIAVMAACNTVVNLQEHQCRLHRGVRTTSTLLFKEEQHLLSDGCRSQTLLRELIIIYTTVVSASGSISRRNLVGANEGRAHGVFTGALRSSSWWRRLWMCSKILPIYNTSLLSRRGTPQSASREATNQPVTCL